MWVVACETNCTAASCRKGQLQEKSAWGVFQVSSHALALGNGDHMRARADEAIYVAYVKIKAAICSLQACIVNASQTTA
jgi:hypothetical protein